MEKDIMLLMKKLIRLVYVQMMIKERNQMIQQKRIHMEQAKI